MISAFLFYFLVTHITASAFSIYVHRGQGHHYFEFSAPLEHFFRFMLWFSSGMSWPNWQQHYAAKHRKHHRFSDTKDDPHSPFWFTVKELFDYKHNTPGKANYISKEEIKLYAPDIKSTNDWIQVNLYNKYPSLGLILFTLLLTILFGWIGTVIGIFNYFCISYFNIFITNYTLHKVGFTYAGNADLDKSKNLFPLGIVLAGEELHANHHNHPENPHFKQYWFELDLGWIYAIILIKLGLMHITSNLKVNN